MMKKDVHKVALRGGFSDRMGIKPINTEIQTTNFDDRTRVAVVNLLNAVYEYVYEPDYDGQSRTVFFSDVLSNVYLQQVTYDINARYDEKRVFDSFINKTIYEDDYDAVLTLLEYLVQEMDKYAQKQYRQIDICNVFNRLFEKEYVGYRFINNRIVPITGKEEVGEINDALVIMFDNVNKHLEKALMFLSNRESPDYENSIKESISAVEAMCSNILGKQGTLGDALKKIEKERVVSIHPALKEAFLKLYGYAGDASSGIRHAAKLGGKDSTFQEARYMLVVCSAFINYLKMNMSEPDRA